VIFSQEFSIYLYNLEQEVIYSLCGGLLLVALVDETTVVADKNTKKNNN